MPIPGPFTVDASVFLNAFNPAESSSPDSRAFLKRIQDEAIPIIVPTLLLVEAAAAISRGRNDSGLASQFAEALSRLPHMVWVSLDATLARQAATIAAQNHLKGSDAVYAAVAARFNTILVTLDQEQKQRTGNIIRTCSPQEAQELT